MLDYAVDSKYLIDGFIKEHVIRQGLDYRTEKAYRLDLEHFCDWMEQKQEENLLEGSEFGSYLDFHIGSDEPEKGRLEDWMEVYLDYLATEKKLSASTVCRKNRVFDYYLSYLTGHGIIADHRSLRAEQRFDKRGETKKLLSKRESDAFFDAMNQEYEKLDSEFRRRICLRDMVMMKLLFCHKIEISELLRMETSDYNQETDMVTIRHKRAEDSQFYLYSCELRKKMKEWIVERKQLRCEGEYYNRMFLSKLGKPLSMKMVTKIFDKYKELAGIDKGFTAKDLKENCMKQYARELAMERCR